MIHLCDVSAFFSNCGGHVDQRSPFAYQIVVATQAIQAVHLASKLYMWASRTASSYGASVAQPAASTPPLSVKFVFHCHLFLGSRDSEPWPVFFRNAKKTKKQCMNVRGCTDHCKSCESGRPPKEPLLLPREVNVRCKQMIWREYGGTFWRVFPAPMIEIDYESATLDSLHCRGQSARGTELLVLR